MYIKQNMNPKNKKVADCVVRAICKALGKTWEEVYRDLCEIGFKLKAMPNDKAAYQKYLTQNNFVRIPVVVSKGSTRPKVAEFAKEQPAGTYLLEIAHHIVVVIDGSYFDTWDCGAKSLYGYWKKIN